MPWKDTNPVNERVQFVAAAEQGLYRMSELCERFGISRETGYEWLRRYRREGVDGLKDRSHAPERCPHHTSAEIEALLVRTREAHPGWGPKTILGYLRPRYPDLPLPAASTVGDVLTRAGLVKPRVRRRHWRHPGRAAVEVSAPNQVWSADFKGQFRTGDGKLCYPLTIADAHTRFLLVCHGLPSTEDAGARPMFERLFRECGLPEAIRTDNGVPFATTAIGGLSRLNLWWAQLGIKHDRIEPRHPEQNGRHERMHRTLKAETARPPASSAAAQQARFDAFRAEFNWERPHHALQLQTPGSLYASSPRTMPERIPGPEYPGHCSVRQVRSNGYFRFCGHLIFLSELLVGHCIALEEIADGVWSIYFYDLLLARLDERTFRVSG